MTIIGYTPDGKPIYSSKPNKPKPNKSKPTKAKPSGTHNPSYSPPHSSGSSHSSSSSSSSKAAANPGAITEAQRVVIARNLRRAYNNLFEPGSNRAVPDGLMARAKREGWDDRASIIRWMQDTHFKLWEKTTPAHERAQEAMQQLDVIFGENNKLKAAFIKEYVWSDPDRFKWDRFLDKKVVQSKAFKKEFPGFATWRNKQGNMDNGKAVTAFAELRNSMNAWYKKVMGNPAATMSNHTFNAAMGQNIQDQESFETYVRTSVPEYAGAAATGVGGSGAAASKAQEFDDLWTGIFGEDVATDPTMRDAYIRSSADANIGDFFNNVIRVSAQFKKAEPEFEAWARASTGLTDASMTHVNPTTFFTERQDLRDKYDVLTEGRGMTNDALIRQAMAGRWSVDRLELEFKAKDPNFAGTKDYTTKLEDLQAYWGGIFGGDSKPTQAMINEYTRGNSTDPTSMFDSIKQTAEFQTQYGNWAEFQTAQDYAGNSTKILRDPAMYKQYQDTFNQAFVAVGIEPPPEFEKRMFASGVDPSTLESNLFDYIQTKDSYNTWTGQQADLATAAGIGNAAAGGDLKLRMKQALEAHKAYANSEFAKTQSEKTKGLVTQAI